ncbi:calcium-activated potassium channel slowpoke-like [Penaeus japonicus]|uniref:calcium-activated potassium channel slowpoke-like n=1 Tax=Penaeus japonicus TaxID=27405 RepID=UPI001C70BF57|nr:calcium-activated potassium channel slowpoke-like [Penaeus japonicus]
MHLEGATCPDKKFLHFLGLIAASYAAAWCVGLALKFFLKRCASVRRAQRRAQVSLRRYCRHHGRLSQTFLVLEISLNILAVCAFFFENHFYQLVENCLPMNENVSQALDWALNLCFISPFIIRIVTINNATRFLTSCYTVADFCTIPPAILGVIIRRSFTGLRFMRILYLLRVPELSVGGRAQLKKYLSYALAAWFVMAGIIQLFESLGDPTDFDNPHNETFATWLYFIVVTVSTVGYGDFSCKTMVGKGITIVIIVFVLSMFARYMPVLLSTINKPPRYFRKYNPNSSKRHIVYCGRLNQEMICHFLNPGINRVTDLVFLGDQTLTLEDRGFFQQNPQGLYYVRGTVLEGLRLAAINEARACIVTADGKSVDPQREDEANVFRVFSILDLTSTTRVMLELLHYQNKEILNYGLSSSEESRLSVFSYSEFKLRLVGYSSLVPGFSTLLANLLLPHTVEILGMSNLVWEREYQYGKRSKIYMEPLSESLEGMTLHEAVELCYRKLKLILLGIKTTDADDSKIIIYPSNPNFIIPQRTLGFFCTRKIKRLQSNSLSVTEAEPSVYSPTRATQEILEHQNFYVTPDRDFDMCIMTEDELKAANLRGHVVVFVLAKPDSPTIGLENICQPLRSDCINPSHFRKIIFMGSLDYMKKEWKQLKNIPEIYVADGSPLAKESLEAVELASCQMCILLSAEPEEFESRLDLAFQVIERKSRRLVRIVDKAATMSGDDSTPDRLSASPDRLPVLASHAIGEPMVSMDTLSLAVGRKIPPSLYQSFGFLNYDNSEVLGFAYTLVTGGLWPGSLKKQISAGYDMVKTRLLPLTSGAFAAFCKEGTYGELFVFALQKYNILCLGLYRELLSSSEELPLRYVITSPEDDFAVRSTDLVFVLCRRLHKSAEWEMEPLPE